MTDSLSTPEMTKSRKCGSMAMREPIDKIRSLLDDVQGITTGRVRDAARSADGALHRHPYSAIGVAVAAGLVIGLLATRR